MLNIPKWLDTTLGLQGVPLSHDISIATAMQSKDGFGSLVGYSVKAELAAYEPQKPRIRRISNLKYVAIIIIIVGLG